MVLVLRDLFEKGYTARQIAFHLDKREPGVRCKMADLGLKRYK